MRFVLDDFESDYETLLKKSGKCTMEVKRSMEVRRSIYLALDLYLLLLVEHLNASYLQNIFIETNKTKRY